ncbi:MAG: peptidylprolyl isomerase [Gemmataceae bacterium]|nr:peptidylprolyl isomerase [Gemmataceae bacterium]
MLSKCRLCLAVVTVGLACAPAVAQTPAQGTPPTAKPAPAQAPPPASTPVPAPTPPAPPAPPPPPPATAVAATVNGLAIPELAVYRATLRDAPGQRDKMRGEVLEFLIDNALIDQYLEQLKVAIDPKEVETKLQQIKDEMKGLDWEKICGNLHLTEADLRTQIRSSLRWDKFVDQYANDKTLKEFFDTNKAMFDGSRMRARHILLKPDAKATEEAKGKLLAIKKQIEEQVAAGMKAVTSQDKLEQEKARMKLLEDAFAGAAAKESVCPTKKEGGELGWFPRAGMMVEPFAKAAFALKPFEMSDVVTSEFGLHLILATGHNAGKEVAFDSMKEIVREVYGDRLREAVISRVRPQARIVINPQPGAKQ